VGVVEEGWELGPLQLEELVLEQAEEAVAGLQLGQLQVVVSPFWGQELQLGQLQVVVFPFWVQKLEQLLEELVPPFWGLLVDWAQ